MSVLLITGLNPADINHNHLEIGNKIVLINKKYDIVKLTYVLKPINLFINDGKGNMHKVPIYTLKHYLLKTGKCFMYNVYYLCNIKISNTYITNTYELGSTKSKIILRLLIKILLCW